ncbi:NADAR family protein [Acetivibrio clariflavus]|uniref:NADAR family protein n=1 Tax=Acetivibrio clariflavus TaxID=288965 RepID=UPI0004873B31|nr:NADAR family protein [Acetivibrio clariflavus]
MKNIYDIQNPIAPPWLMYPHIPRGSIGWRMGYGEDYIYKFIDWYDALTIEEQKQFQQMFPTPKGWQGWYDEDFAEEDFYDDEGCLQWNEGGKMKYSLVDLQKDFREGKKIEYLFFWGHQPSRDGSITKSCLSQWWKSDFTVDIYTYCCMEQYMMAEKARIFGDEEILEEILKNKNPKQIKALGRKVRNFDEEVWKKKRYSIILNGNYAKFIQNKELRRFLVETKNRVLVEASPYDKIWGIGMAADDENVENPLQWKGQNLLGFALMEVREEIIRVCKNYDKLDMKRLQEDFS